MRRGIVAAPLLGLFAAVGLGSCGSEGDGGGSGSGGSGPDASSEASFGSSACGICVASACGGERQACLSEPSCATFLVCLEGCPLEPSGDAEAGCEAACPTSVGTVAKDAQDALKSCRSFGPGAQCTGCGVDPGPDLLPPDQCSASTMTDSCSKCLDESCCQVASTCAKNSECIGFQNCWTACPDLDIACKTTCFTTHAGGAAPWLRYAACGTRWCDTACGVGDPCTTCVKQKCPNTQLACDLSPACFVLGLCYAGCPDLDAACFEKCRQDASPEVLLEFDAASICRAHACKLEC